jgi:hypothetical protein
MHFHFSEKGLVTFAVLICCTTLILSGKDGIIGYSLLGVVTGYFGLELGPIQWISKRKEKKK